MADAASGGQERRGPELGGGRVITRRASDLLRAMANEHRLRILCELTGGERPVGALVRCAGLSPSAVSQHLARLRREELVRTRRDGQTIYYAVCDDHVRAVIEVLHRLDGGGDEADGRGSPAPRGGV